MTQGNDEISTPATPSRPDGIWVFVLAALPCLIGLGVMVSFLA